MNIKLKCAIFILQTGIMLGNMYKRNTQQTRSPIAEENLEWNRRLNDQLKKESLRIYEQKKIRDSIHRAKEITPEIIFGTLY